MKKFVLQKEDNLSNQNFTIDYEDLLNPAQLEVVMHGNGPALVIAGAGTGKTRTLIYRLSRLIESGTDPTSILLLTFTRRAAGEMLRQPALFWITGAEGWREALFIITAANYCISMLKRSVIPSNLPSSIQVMQWTRFSFFGDGSTDQN
ncbi:hypothetical protein BH23BAC3_BH23BAC3_12270 [soil metagenome]